MSLATQFAASQDVTFQQLIQAAIVQQAVAISRELPSVKNHFNRAQLAAQVLLNPSLYVSGFAQAVASQSIDKNATDIAVLGAVSAVWNTVAGLG